MTNEERIEELRVTLAERKNTSSELKLGIIRLQSEIEERQRALLIVERTIGKLEGAILAFTGETR